MPRKRTTRIFPVEDGRQRVVIEGVSPEIDCGAFAAKRAQNEPVEVSADAFTDGHDVVVCLLAVRAPGEKRWIEWPMLPLGNDRWRGEFRCTELGEYRYTLIAWADAFFTWQRDLQKRLDAVQANPETDANANPDLALAFAIGATLVQAAAARAKGADKKTLTGIAAALNANTDVRDKALVALAGDFSLLMQRYADRRFQTVYPRELRVRVERPRARFGAWYEFFPRSCGKDGRHGTFKDCEARLQYVADMGFDVVYLPPIHPIGDAFRKGKNNTLNATADDVGSPWAIGAATGGHTAVHPALGTLADFRRFVAAAQKLDLEIALDIAFQCSPDHPYVDAHPEWFRRRPDGSVQYAENPPKKYQDIYPFDFESEDWQALWAELVNVFEFWIAQGVRIFRVDNPHTKPFPFWQWALAQVKAAHPDVVFLSEAFTRPRIMHRLAKLGFTQSYTYFTWRNTKAELTEYFTGLTQGSGREYFWPNVWPNTPDILHEYFQLGGRPAFIARAVLAATLAASYGIYGPAFELGEHAPIAPGAEEYLHSEKYQLRTWDLARPDSLRDLLTRLNRARRANAALQHEWNLRFHATDNPEIICYSKATADKDNVIVMLVNLDYRHVQSGWVDLDLAALGLPVDVPFEVKDLLTDAHYAWRGARNYVRLDPRALPAHVLRIGRSEA